MKKEILYDSTCSGKEEILTTGDTGVSRLPIFKRIHALHSCNNDDLSTSEYSENGEDLTNTSGSQHDSMDLEKSSFFDICESLDREKNSE